MNKCSISILFLAGLSLCGQGLRAQEPSDASLLMNQQSFADLVAGFNAPERALWQKPDEVIAALGDLNGKTVMDIGSGTGYFSFRLLEAGANVICGDVDERFLGYIAGRKEELGLTDSQLELRLLPYDSSMLQANEVDMVLLVDTYHHIDNRVTYFSEVLAGLRPGGQLVVVDFFKQELPVGPPYEMKLDLGTIIDELRTAGFKHFDIDLELLPYQYIIVAQ